MKDQNPGKKKSESEIKMGFFFFFSSMFLYVFCKKPLKPQTVLHWINKRK